MFTCPTCTRPMPDNEKYVYYLMTPGDHGKTFPTPQHSCGRCLPMKTAKLAPELVREREPVPDSVRAAFEDDWILQEFN